MSRTIQREQRDRDDDCTGADGQPADGGLNRRQELWLANAQRTIAEATERTLTDLAGRTGYYGVLTLSLHIQGGSISHIKVGAEQVTKPTPYPG